MSPRRGSFRAFVILWAALQLALPGVAALADAFASRTSVHATAHVEASTERDCVRVHETDCVFCQFLSAPAAPGSGAPPLAVAATVGTPAAPRRDIVALASTRDPAIPRAPPLS